MRNSLPKRIKTFFIGNIEEDNCFPNLIQRFRNRINRGCSCGLFRCCMFDYIEMEEKYFKQEFAKRRKLE